MQSLVHVCKSCSCSTIVPFSAFVFSQNHVCPHCGAISTGINIDLGNNKKEEDKKADMQQDELARLFSAHMNLSQQQQQQVHQPEPEPQHEVPEEQPPAYHEIEHVSQPITYISQHYTHSYHVAPVARHASAPPSTHVEPSELEAVLLRNSIDPSLLFPSQIELFQNADNDQRLRLLELWRISPPQGRQGYPSGVDYNTSRQLYDWPPTSLAQEEAMAKLRYESLMEEKAQQEEIRKHQQQLDQSMDMNTEPYILSGYEMMAAREYDQSAANHLKESSKYNQATDPVYNSGGGLWEKNVGSILDMENQYGAFAHARDHDVMPVYVDDEMML